MLAILSTQNEGAIGIHRRLESFGPCHNEKLFTAPDRDMGVAVAEMIAKTNKIPLDEGS